MQKYYVVITKEQNIHNYIYIENIDGYFGKNIDKIKINKNILKFIKIFCLTIKNI